MHNSYIEMLVRYGFIGAAIFLILFIWIGIQLHQAYRHKVIDKDIYGFLLLSFIFMAVINLTESYFFYWTGSYLITLLTSICVTDRKSTRLNSSHVRISYAVFCLKKKKQ